MPDNTKNNLESALKNVERLFARPDKNQPADILMARLDQIVSRFLELRGADIKTVPDWKNWAKSLALDMIKSIADCGFEIRKRG